MFNSCYEMKWSDCVISVSINLMDGLFIATHVNGCTTYFTVMYPEAQLPSSLWTGRIAGLCLCREVSKSVFRGNVVHIWRQTLSYMSSYWREMCVCVCGCLCVSVWWGRSRLTSSNNTRKRSARIRAPQAGLLLCNSERQPFLKTHIL